MGHKRIWKERTTGESSGSHGSTKSNATTPRGFPHRKFGSKSRTFESDIGRIYVAETPTQVVPHGPKKETSSPDSQTDSAEKKPEKKDTQQIPVFYSS